MTLACRLQGRVFDTFLRQYKLDQVQRVVVLWLKPTNDLSAPKFQNGISRAPPVGWDHSAEWSGGQLSSVRR
jgi:hypothetical protein